MLGRRRLQGHHALQGSVVVLRRLGASGRHGLVSVVPRRRSDRVSPSRTGTSLPLPAGHTLALLCAPRIL